MWTETKKSLSRKFSFTSFIEAFAFVNKVGLIASRNDHFPKICLENNNVDITLSTDKIGGFVTHKDHEMANEIDEAFSKKEVFRKTA